MIELKFKEIIHAAPEKVHQIMLERETYREWTKIFSPSSDVVGDWSKGTKMHFTSKDENGEIVGMVTMVDENILGQIVKLRHIGFLKNSTEILEGSEVEAWKNALEVYQFNKSDNNFTELVCSVEIEEGSYEKHFMEIWPQALKRLKELCEQ